MSRTWRRTQKGKKACHEKQLDKGIEYTTYSFSLWPHTFNIGEDYFYWMTTPSHWNNRYHTRPRRRKESQLLHQIKTGFRDYDEVVFPDGRKPTIYFW